MQSYSFYGNYPNVSDGFDKVKTYKITEAVKQETLTQEKRQTQKQRIIDCFAEQPRTMLQVSLITGILRANICRVVAKLRKVDRIQVHHYGIDPYTKCGAGFLTTNPALFTPSVYNQSKLTD